MNDIQEELDSLKANNNNNNNKINAKTIDDVLDNNIKKLEDFVNNKVINIYSRPWNKLESKLKKNKILQFLTIKLENKEINNNEYDIVYKNLIKEIDLNKTIKLEYNIEDCIIEKINFNNYL